MKILPSVLLLLFALFCTLISLGSLLAGAFALRSQETLVAIESLFGSVIVAILFAVLARRLFQLGLSRLKMVRKPPGDSPPE
jgi:hypothetical protein